MLRARKPRQAPRQTTLNVRRKKGLDDWFWRGVSGAEGLPFGRLKVLTTIEPESYKAKRVLTPVAGRASKVIVVTQEFWSGWQILTVSSGWRGPDTMTTPAASERLPRRMRAAIIELRTRRSKFENACPISLIASSRTARGYVQGQPDLFRRSGHASENGIFTGTHDATPEPSAFSLYRFPQYRQINSPCEHL